MLKDPSKEDKAEIGSLYSDKVDLVLFHRLPKYIQFEIFKNGKKLFIRDKEYINVLNNIIRFENHYKVDLLTKIKNFVDRIKKEFSQSFFILSKAVLLRVYSFLLPLLVNIYMSKLLILFYFQE